LKPFPTKDCLPERQVKNATGALHLGIFEQPKIKTFLVTC
jgi:hypothetical protein